MNGFGDFRENWLDGLSRETFIYTHPSMIV